MPTPHHITFETHIQRKTIALQKQFEISIIAQCRVICNFLNALVERKSAVLDKGFLEAIKGALLWYRRYNHAWIVVAQRLV
jgi:hypothetical protein